MRNKEPQEVMADCLAANVIAMTKEIETLRNRLNEALEEIQKLKTPISDSDLSLLICNADEGDWNSHIYQKCWEKGFIQGVKEREYLMGILS
jgi:hypothetical protein